jgi:ABC-type long-subunit fatty acid transport system fused permease/ATPase subunit
MLSQQQQLLKMIKIALKFIVKNLATLRVWPFTLPVFEWRQRMEGFYMRSMKILCNIACASA